ncbi:hypothetical protein O6H91_01G065800 [Diphasiastrum complanatum]|uniref:Uncharacterized protein n=1 Tax=Diphasiastrum complanatum TaxID=34168 RepID=A0ACC2ERY7_DIPCM|nr:hypothetical protein O6H91_01G065800 [Diphasiastrum complanatum]
MELRVERAYNADPCFSTSYDSIGMYRSYLDDDFGSLRMANVPFLFLENEDPDEEIHQAGRKKIYSSFDRQRYLRTYTFSTEQSVAERVKSSFWKLKSKAMELLACQYSFIKKQLGKSQRRGYLVYSNRRLSALSCGFHLSR